MHLYSLTFLYLLLPVSVVVCLFLPPRARAWAVVTLSAFCYASIEHERVLLIAAVILADYLAARLLGRCEGIPRLRTAVATVSAGANLALFVLYGVLEQLYGLHIPLGLGVVCLTGAGYLADCYYGYVASERSLVSFALVMGFFPRLYAGPLVYYGRTVPQIHRMRMSLERIGRGGRVFVQGLAKKVILGDGIYQIYVRLHEVHYYNAAVLHVWMMVACLSLAICFLLSGLCDMARGLGLIFGLDLPENFRDPFRSISINDFFSRFNITVNRFMRKYVYTAFGAPQGGTLSGIFNILLLSILIGLWYGIRLNMVVWGLYFSALVLCEKFLLRRIAEAIPPVLRWIGCTIAVQVSFVLFAGSSLKQSVDYLRVMFGLSGADFLSNEVLYLLNSNYLLLLVAVFCASGMGRVAAGFFRRTSPQIWEMVSTLLTLILLVVTTAFML